MGGLADLVAALTLLGAMKVREAQEEDRKSRQEEAFVPFKLPPLAQRERPTCQLATAVEPQDAVDMSASRAWSNP